MLLTIEKPMTRILPELHEDNDNLSHNSDVGGDGSKLEYIKLKGKVKSKKDQLRMRL